MIQPTVAVSSEAREIPIMTVWPSIAMYGLGRLMGRLYAIKIGFYVFTVGNFFALASIPVALVLYFLRVLPVTAVRYTITNRRIIVQKGLKAVNAHWVDLDRFDRIDVEVQRGQQWYDAGDLVFTNEGIETFRLPGVSRPLAFRQVCWNAHMAYVGVRAALARADAQRG